MTPEERIAKAFHDYQYGPLNLEQYLAAAIRAAVEAEREAKSAELEAAREIIKTLRQHRDAGGEVWRSIDEDFAAYDAAVKASRP